MTRSRMFFIFIFVAWFQLMIVPLIKVGPIAPDFIFLFLIFSAFVNHDSRIYIIAFLVGLFKDLMAHTIFGLETASLMCGIILLREMVSRFDCYDWSVRLGLVFLFSLVSLLIFNILSIVVQKTCGHFPIVLINSILISIYTTLVAPIAFYFFNFVYHIKKRERQYELF